MSGEGPESIPTSADPRSKRPVKKRALTPGSAQAKDVDALFARPDQEVRIPLSATSGPRRLAAPPEIVTNVQGSSAGAGSGEFHVYKASRRREYERLRQMDDEVRREKDTADFESAKLEREDKDNEKTRKNREKREKKMKARQKAKINAKTGTNADENGAAVRSEQHVEPQQFNKLTPQNDGKDSASGAATQAAGIVIHDDE